MALDDLLSALEADAAAETERLRSRADAEAARLVEAAHAQARAYELDADRADEAELARELEGRRSEARLAAARTLRAAREASLSALEEALRRRLGALRETDAYPRVLRALVEEGLSVVPRASVLRVDPRDSRPAEEIARRLGARLEVEPELDTLGGAELADGDGRTARNTFEERMRNAAPELRLLATELLHGGSAERGTEEDAPT